MVDEPSIHYWVFLVVEVLSNYIYDCNKEVLSFFDRTPISLCNSKPVLLIRTPATVLPVHTPATVLDTPPAVSLPLPLTHWWGVCGKTFKSTHWLHACSHRYLGEERAACCCSFSEWDILQALFKDITWWNLCFIASSVNNGCGWCISLSSLALVWKEGPISMYVKRSAERGGNWTFQNKCLCSAII